MCQGMGRAGRSGGHALLWGDTRARALPDPNIRPDNLCADYIYRRVSGVFFAPIELLPNKDEVNLSITEALGSAGIPVVLLDRCIKAYPERSRFDLVGVDNRRIGCRITNHLVSQGATNLVFLGPALLPLPRSRLAHAVSLMPALKARVIHGDPADRDFVREFMNQFHPDGVSAQMMQLLLN